jgi:hypothetical protein
VSDNWKVFWLLMFFAYQFTLINRLERIAVALEALK